MKADSLTLAGLLLVIGLVITGVGQLEIFESESEAPSDLQRGFTPKVAVK